MTSTILLLASNGLAWGLIVALIALGLSIIFGLLDIVNVGHGELFMLGAVGAWFVVGWTGSFWWALLIMPMLGALLGVAIQKAVIEPVQASPSLSIVATFGVALILQECARAVFGAAPQRLEAPVSGTLPLLGVRYDIYRIVAAGIAAVVLMAFFLFLHRTKFGTWMRAVRMNKDMATALGIPSNRVFLATFAIGSGIAMLGGVVAAPITSVEYRLGVDILPICFMAVIIGGLGNLPGTVAAAIGLAVIEGVVTAFFDPTVARILSLVVMSGVLLVRPQGLFAR